MPIKFYHRKHKDLLGKLQKIMDLFSNKKNSFDGCDTAILFYISESNRNTFIYVVK